MTHSSEGSGWEHVLEVIKHYFPAVAVVAGMELDLFTPLGEGPKTVEELAAEIEVQPHRLRLLLNTLVAAGLLDRDGDRFVNLPVANEYLVKGRPKYMGGAHALYTDLFSSAMQTAQSIRSGAPQATHDDRDMDEDELRTFLRGLVPGASAHGRLLAKKYDFSRFGTILDVGGGAGGLVIAACEACPDLRAQVIELPRVARISEEFIAEAGLSARITPLGHDMTAAPLGELHDAAVLRNLLQVLSNDDARRVVDHVALSLHPGGEVFIIGAFLDDDRMGPAGALALNIFFLNAFQAGQAYTEAECRGWLEAAGFMNFERSRIPMGFDLSLITARKRP